MNARTDDLRIREIREVIAPAELVPKYPCDDLAADTVVRARTALHGILHGKDDRLAVVIGPCSIHDVDAALEYATRLKEQRDRFQDVLEIVMRVYFEKPRTTVGWKGLINDPGLDATFRINDGLHLARRLLLDVARLGLPAGYEFLDMIMPQYIADLVSWGAIGARTTESQVHRELASGLSCPVGFKNGTDGNLKVAVDAMLAASRPHHFLTVTKHGQCAIATTLGNSDCHVILRGGIAPNYDAASVASAGSLIAAAGFRTCVMVDASHGNSGKHYQRQTAVVEAIAAQVEAGERRIGGVMVESHLRAGSQPWGAKDSLVYGQSITDGCIDWEMSVQVLERLAIAVARRRVCTRKTASDAEQATRRETANSCDGAKRARHVGWWS